MSRLRETLIVIGVLWIVWVWEPLLRLSTKLVRPWAIHFGFRPCCDNPNPRITGVADQEVQECLNCGTVRSHGTWYYLP